MILQEVETLRPIARCNGCEFLCDLIEESFRKRDELIQVLQAAVEQLDLDVKYLVFDLECTKRERDELREQWS